MRRGLPGEIIWRLSQWFTLNPAQIAIVIQLVVFTTFTFLVYLLLQATPPSVITFTLLFSPSFLLFSLLSWPMVGVRKEVFLWIIIVGQLLMLRKAQPPDVFLLWLIGSSTLFAVLSHEMLVIFLPYLLIATVCYEQRFGRLSLQTTIAMIPAIIAAIIILRAPQATIEAVDAICTSLGTHAPPRCLDHSQLGSITFLTQTVYQGIQFTRHFTTPETTTVYTITGLLSFIPPIITIVSYRLWRLFPPRTLALIGGLWGSSVAATIPLFIVAADYGRFVNIHVTCSTLILVWLLQTSPDLLNTHVRPATGWWPVAILFVISWRLPMWLKVATFVNAFPWLGW